MNEQWKDIAGYKGYYQISNYGHVRSLDRYISDKNGKVRFLKGQDMKLSNQKGRKNDDSKYLVVNLKMQGTAKVFSVHRLVAEHFIPNPNKLPTINHKDGNKSNNIYINLEWSTFSENNTHALYTGLRHPRGRRILQYDKKMTLLGEYKSVSEAARKTNINRGSISHCLNNRTNNAGGFIWKYKNNINEDQTTKFAKQQETVEDELPLVAQDNYVNS